MRVVSVLFAVLGWRCFLRSRANQSPAKPSPAPYQKFPIKDRGALDVAETLLTREDATRGKRPRS